MDAEQSDRKLQKKICASCGILKPLDEFVLDPEKLIRQYSPFCISCRSKMAGKGGAKPEDEEGGGEGGKGRSLSIDYDAKQFEAMRQERTFEKGEAEKEEHVEKIEEEKTEKEEIEEKKPKEEEEKEKEEKEKEQLERKEKTPEEELAKQKQKETTFNRRSVFQKFALNKQIFVEKQWSQTRFTSVSPADRTPAGMFKPQESRSAQEAIAATQAAKATAPISSMFAIPPAAPPPPLIPGQIPPQMVGFVALHMLPQLTRILSEVKLFTTFMHLVNDYKLFSLPQLLSTTPTDQKPDLQTTPTATPPPQVSQSVSKI